jgi:hypothetical protein
LVQQSSYYNWFKGDKPKVEINTSIIIIIVIIIMDYSYYCNHLDVINYSYYNPVGHY